MLAAPLLGVADSAEHSEVAPTAGSVEISDPGVEVAIPGLLSQEVVVWVEDFGWMGSEDLFAALELEVDAPGFGEEPGSEESLEVLAAVLAVLGERAESSHLDEPAAPEEVVRTRGSHTKKS